ncbi:hypothetical protein JCM10450v2_000179 [Rhodotorula kratochvilovae]
MPSASSASLAPPFNDGPSSPTTASTAFVAPNSRRGARNCQLPEPFSINADHHSDPSSASCPSSRSARVEYTPPVPSAALDLLHSSPPVPRTVPGHKPIVQQAPPIPHPHFIFQAPMNPRPRRPKTSDSSMSASASKGSFKKAFAAAFGMSSSGSGKTDARSAPAPAPFQPVSPPPQLASRDPVMEQATRRMRAMEIARETGRKAVAYVRRKLNSKTPEHELPKTWKEFEVLYANGDVDVSDPPLPPQRFAEEGAEPTPYEKMEWAAPMGANEAIRQDVVNRLDLFGTRRAMSSQTTLDISSPAAPGSVAMTPSDSHASASSYLTTTSNAASSRRDSSSGFSTASAATSMTTAAMPSPDLDAEAVASLENSPVFRSIISKAREILDVPIALVTVLDGDKQLFLASGGLPDGLDKGMPRSASFCQHTILGGGMVVLNSSEDWRFANGMVSKGLGGKFYAGIPVNCHAPGETDGDSPAVPVGSLCVLDMKARTEFSDAHRRVLRDLAQQCANAIEAWSSERTAQKLRRVRGSIATGSAPQLTKAALRLPPNLAPASSSTELVAPSSASVASSSAHARRPKTAGNPPTSALPATPPASIRHSGSRTHARTNSDAASTISSIPASDIVAPAQRRPSTLSLGVTTEDPISTLPRDVQKTFDTAVRMLAKSLDLELVYLAALDLAALAPASDTASIASLPLSAATASSKLRVLASHGLPSPPPSFDPALHVKALRAPEGGLIYKNPRFTPSAAASYAAGILIPVLEVRRTGFVLCAYSRAPERAFVQRDLALLVKMAEGLETACVKASKSLTAASFA